MNTLRHVTFCSSPMPFLLLPCLFCSPSSSAEDDSTAAFGGAAASTNPSTSSSSAYEPPSYSASASDDAASVLTHPSLPSLQSLNLPSVHFSASFHYLSSIAVASPGAGAAALAASPSSLLLYSATESSLTIHDLSDLRPIESLPIPPGTGAAKSATLSTDGATLFIAHQDGRIRVWRRSSRSGLHRLFTSLPTFSDRLRRFPFPENHVAVRRHRKRLWIEHADAVSGIAAGGTSLVYSVSWDKTLKIWSTSGLHCLESVAAHEDAVNAVAVASDGTIYTGSADGKIRIWVRPAGAKRHDLVATLVRHRSAVNALALSADGTVLYSGACDRSVLVWEREDSAAYMAVTGALRGHEAAILSIACAGEIVVTGSGDRTVRIWRREEFMKGYSCLAEMKGHAKGVRSLVAVRMPACSGSGGGGEDYRVCSGSLDGEVRVWRVRVSSGQV